MALIKYNDPVSLTQSINMVETVEPFMLKRFFNTKEFHPTSQFIMPRKKTVTGMAQFVPEDAEALTVNNSIEEEYVPVIIPRTFEKKVFTASELEKIQVPGRVFVQDKQELINRANEYTLSELKILKSRVELRKEAMACEALTTGKIVYNGDAINFTVDFGFKPEQLPTLDAVKQWGKSGVYISDSLDEYADMIGNASHAPVRTVILGSKAASVFQKDANVMKELDTINYKVGSLDLTTSNNGWGRYLGRYRGYDIYTYSQKYFDTKTKSLVDLFPANNALLVGDLDGAMRMHFAPAKRINDSFGLDIDASEYYVQPLINEDRTAFEWRVENHSLTCIHAPQTVVCAKVVA